MIKKLGISLITLAIMLTLWELGIRYSLRAAPFAPTPYIAPYLTERDATLRWRYSAGGGRNSLGLRNREITPKPAGVYRILVLGDSLVWGAEMSSGKSWTQEIEDRLNARYGNESRRYEVINAGVPGYTTYQELEFLKIYGMAMEPDFVLLGYVFNDLYYPYLHAPTPANLIGPEQTIRLNRFDPDTLPGFFLSQSYLANQLALGTKIFWRRNILQREMFPFELTLDFYLAWYPHAWKRANTLIGEMRGLLSAQHLGFAILVYPVSDQVKDQYLALDRRFVLYPQSRIMEIAAAQDIPLLDLTDAIYANGGTELYQDYLHMNRRGNDVVANQVENFMLNELKLTTK